MKKVSIVVITENGIMIGYDVESTLEINEIKAIRYYSKVVDNSLSYHDVLSQIVSITGDLISEDCLILIDKLIGIGDDGIAILKLIAGKDLEDYIL